MTSWLRKYGSVPLCVLLCCSAVAVCAGAGDSVCWSPSVTSCLECLTRGPRCAWCFKEDFMDGMGQSQRCDLPVNLLRRGCEADFMERSEVKVEVNATISSTQVSPRDISITLRPGSAASIVVAVKQLDRYPVDLYYLVDVSASMQENLDHLKTVGMALSLRMTEHSSDLWLGFGSFVDKPVSPYINVHPSKISNPCSDYEIRCRPTHGFHHVLSMTANMSEFTRVIKRQRISGNMDTPEGGLDAMLQATVCQRAVGWRTEAKRLLLLMTDQPSHLALDSRLAGIVMPHDGRCHLENNVYTGSTRMDHPSIGQLSDKVLENHIYSIFAVEKQQYRWYEILKETNEDIEEIEYLTDGSWRPIKDDKERDRERERSNTPEYPVVDICIPEANGHSPAHSSTSLTAKSVSSSVGTAGVTGGTAVAPGGGAVVDLTLDSSSEEEGGGARGDSEDTEDSDDSPAPKRGRYNYDKDLVTAY